MEDGVKRMRKMEENSMEVCPRRCQVGKHELQEELGKRKRLPADRDMMMVCTQERRLENRPGIS